MSREKTMHELEERSIQIEFSEVVTEYGNTAHAFDTLEDFFKQYNETHQVFDKSMNVIQHMDLYELEKLLNNRECYTLLGDYTVKEAIEFEPWCLQPDVFESLKDCFNLEIVADSIGAYIRHSSDDIELLMDASCAIQHTLAK
jgi:hypothetical protein